MPRPSTTIDTAGHDSFLDVVSNIVGILVILVMVVGLRIRNAPVPWDQSPALRAQRTRLEKDQARVAAGRRSVAELERQLQAVQRETAVRRRTRDQLATLVAALGHDLQAARSRLDAGSQRTFDLRSQLAQAERRLRDLEDQLAHARSIDPEPRIVQNRPTPLSQTVAGTEIHFQLRGGRIAFIPLDTLVDAFKSDAQRKASRLHNLPEITETIGPEGGFRFRYTLQRVTRSPEEMLARGGIEIRLKKWTLIPVASDLGEPVDAALEAGSRFRQVLAGYHPETATVTIWVYPDSFPEFRRLKEELFRMGFATAARPLPDGFPISGSPQGTRSTAE